MRHIQEPFTLAKHPELLSEINDLMIAIKLHHIDCDEKKEKAEQWAKAQSNCMCPTWENVEQVLNKCYKVINDKRENPIKY